MSEKVEIPLKKDVKRTSVFLARKKSEGKEYIVPYSSVPVKHKCALLWFNLGLDYPAFLVIPVPTDTKIRKGRIECKRETALKILYALREANIWLDFTDVEPEEFEEEKEMDVADPFTGEVKKLKYRGNFILSQPYRVDNLMFTEVLTDEFEIPEDYEKYELPENYGEVMGCDKVEGYINKRRDSIMVICERKDKWGLTDFYVHYWHKLKSE